MQKKHSRQIPEITKETFIFIAINVCFITFMVSIMGGVNMINTIMSTSYNLLINVCFYIMSIAVLSGAASGILSEFGVISLINKLLSKLMKPIYDLPGAASLGVLTCYLSDNPAILTLAKEKNFLKYFKKYQIPALTNIGTSFGMGLIITTTLIGIGVPNGTKAVLIGNIGAIIGSIVSVRIMLHFSKKYYSYNKLESELDTDTDADATSNTDEIRMREIRNGSFGTRAIESLLAGGKSGVDMGISIIPGVLIICTFVLMITNGPSESGLYTGAAYEGVPILSWIGQKLHFIFTPLFGFSSPEALAIPITALGAAGAAIGLIPDMVDRGIVHANDIAVFTAISMCWSGYLSTHIAMLDSLNCSELTGKAILSHTIGGLVAGIASNLLFKIF